jgi:hypothetical protein
MAKKGEQDDGTKAPGEGGGDSGGTGGASGGASPSPPPPAEAGAEASGSDAMASRLRTLARRAEARAEELAQRVQELEASLHAAQAALEQRERAHEVERALLDAGAVDVETARLVVERVLLEMETPDVAAAVERVRGDKPFLFASPTPTTGFASVAMGERVDGGDRDELSRLAEAALSSGRRRDVLRYLRARAGG